MSWIPIEDSSRGVSFTKTLARIFVHRHSTWAIFDKKWRICFLTYVSAVWIRLPKQPQKRQVVSPFLTIFGTWNFWWLNKVRLPESSIKQRIHKKCPSLSAEFSWTWVGPFPIQHGGFKYFFHFHPENWGNDPIWLAHIFQMGWFNHQLENQERRWEGLFSLHAPSWPGLPPRVPHQARVAQGRELYGFFVCGVLSTSTWEGRDGNGG